MGGTGIGSQTSTPTTSTPTTLDPSGTLGGSYGGVAVGSGTNLGDAPVGTQTGVRADTIISTGVDRPELGNNSSVSQPNVITYGNIRFGDLPSGGTGTNQGVVRDQAGNVILSPISNVPVTEPTPTMPPRERTLDTTLIDTITTTPPRDTTTGDEIIPMEIPEFPNLSNMSCADLNAEISRLSSIMATSRFPPNVGNAYNNQLALAKTLYTTKCPVTPPAPPTPVIPVIPVEPIGGGGGGFGGGFGGGGGMAPEDELPQEEIAPEESGSGKGILLLLAIIGGLYFLTRK
jgi:hypothetical protein